MATTPRKPCRPTQAELPFRSGRGGARRGAGRKPNGERAGVAHTPRPALPERFPVHVTIKLRSGLPKLRQPRERKLLLAAFAAAKQRAGRSGKRFRLTHFAILNDHLHLLAEAEDRLAVLVPESIDLFSSAPWFDGFREAITVRNLPTEPPVVAPRTWLLSIGWRRRGLLSVHELPASA